MVVRLNSSCFQDLSAASISSAHKSRKVILTSLLAVVPIIGNLKLQRKYWTIE